MWVTNMRFSVRVPVLSQQITVVEPSVSTALSRFTNAPRDAMLRTPTASARVIVGSRPSGTLLTRRPIAKRAALENESPATNVPSGKNASPTKMATNAISHATRRTSRSSGLSPMPTRCDSDAMRPSSLCMPVANTTARASPPEQVVPLKTRSDASRNATSSAPSTDVR